MHPAFSVIFLTTLIGVGQGLFLALYTGQLYSVVNVLPVQDSHSFYGLGSLLTLVFLLAGLVASVFHLGRPERAWRTATRWRSSWLSREVIVLPAFIALTALYGVINYYDLNPVLFSLNGEIHVELSLVVGGVNTVLAFALFFCTAMIYACVKFLQEWATPLTVVNYTLLGSASGFSLATAFAAYTGSGLVAFYAAWAVIITLAAFVTRIASLLRNANIKYKSSLRSAIGIRHSNIQQKSCGFMAGSFNTREYFHGATKRKFRSVKWTFLLLVFPLPVLLIGIGLGTSQAQVFALAFAIQYLGLLAERWFFFAQARHPQNLYYQTA
jgi:DMSO reductase anchor subunit